MGNVLVDSDHSLSPGDGTRALDLAVGGQQGALSDPKQWISSAAYARQKMIAVLIEAPGHMQYMDNGPSRIAMLKSLVELMPTSITGLQSNLEATFGDHKISNAGEVHSTFIGSTRTPSAPSFIWPEKEGMAVNNFFDQWIVELLADPETGHPGLVNKEAYIAAGYPEFLPNAVSMTVLFIEPSKDLSKVTTAWLSTNMMPKSAGERTGSRVIGEANATVEQTIEFTATTQRSLYVDKMAKTFLDSLQEKGFRPAALAGYYDEVSSAVQGADDSESYASKAGKVAEAVDGATS